MPIDRWRCVKDTDDGCSEFQCLACYATWEARTAPGWTDPDGHYTGRWDFCPCCGCCWDGEQVRDPGRERIKDLTWSRRVCTNTSWELDQSKTRDSGDSRRSYPWVPAGTISYGKLTPTEVLRWARERKAMAEEYDRETDWRPYELTSEYRLRKLVTRYTPGEGNRRVAEWVMPLPGWRSVFPRLDREVSTWGEDEG